MRFRAEQVTAVRASHVARRPTSLQAVHRDGLTRPVPRVGSLGTEEPPPNGEKVHILT